MMRLRLRFLGTLPPTVVIAAVRQSSQPTGRIRSDRSENGKPVLGRAD